MKRIIAALLLGIALVPSPSTATEPEPVWQACFWNGVRWNVPCVHDARHPVSTGGGDITQHRFSRSFKMGDFNGDGYIDIKTIRHRRAHNLLGY